MYCRSDVTSCRLPVSFSSASLSGWGGEDSQELGGKFRLCMISDAWVVYLHFRSLYIESILWDMIQGGLG